MPLGPLISASIAIIMALSASLFLGLKRRKNRSSPEENAAGETGRRPEFYTPVMPRVLPVLYLTLGNAALILFWAIALNYALNEAGDKELTNSLLLVALPLFGLPLVGLFYAYKKGVFHDNT